MLHKNFQEVKYSASECDYKVRVKYCAYQRSKQSCRWKRVFGTEVSEVSTVSEY